MKKILVSLVLIYVSFFSIYGYVSAKEFNALDYVNILDEEKQTNPEDNDEKIDTEVKENCGEYISPISGDIKTIIGIAQLAAIVLVIVLGMMDFVKAAIQDDGDLKKTATKRFTRRLIALVLFLVLPSLINFILHAFGLFNQNSDPLCGLAMILKGV